MSILHLDPTQARTIDAISVSTIAATIAGWLPTLAVLLPVLYYMIQIWETKTVQRWLERRREYKALKRRLAHAKMAAQQKVDQAAVEAAAKLRDAVKEAQAVVETARVEAVATVVEDAKKL